VCLYLVSVDQTAPLLTAVSDIIETYYSFIDPEKMKGWVGQVGLHQWSSLAAGQAKDKESSPVNDRRSTTVPCNQPQDALACVVLATVTTSVDVLFYAILQCGKCCIIKTKWRFFISIIIEPDLLKLFENVTRVQFFFNHGV